MMLERNGCEVRTERDIMRLMCDVALIDMKRLRCLIQMLGFNDSMDQFAKTNCVISLACFQE